MWSAAREQTRMAQRTQMSQRIQRIQGIRFGGQDGGWRMRMIPTSCPWSGQILRHLPGRSAAVGHAIGYTDPAKPAAGDEEARPPRQSLLDRAQPRQVTDFVLRAHAFPAVDAREGRFAADAEQRREG